MSAGHLECVHLHCVRCYGVARHYYFIRSAIHSVSQHQNPSSTDYPLSFTYSLSQVCAAHRAISSAPRSIHRLPSRICTWSSASRAPSPLDCRRGCGCPERPLGTNIRGTRVSDILTDLFPLCDIGNMTFLQREEALRACPTLPYIRCISGSLGWRHTNWA